MRVIEEKLELIKAEIDHLRKERDLAADVGNTSAENILSDQIDQLSKSYILLNNKAIALLDGSKEMNALLQSFAELDDELKKKATDLSRFAHTIDTASLLVKGLADVVRVIV